MQIIQTITKLRTVLNDQGLGQQNKTAFVPTMGNLHAGHIVSVEVAKQHANLVVTSIFFELSTI